MELPLYLIEEKRGIPLPDSTFELKIPHKLKNYFQPATNGGKHQIAIGISTHDDITEIVHDIKQLLVYTHEIAIVCQPIAIAEIEHGLSVLLKVDYRIKIKQILRVGDTFATIYDEVVEQFSQGEEGLDTNITALAGAVSTDPKTFGVQLVTELHKATWPFTMMNHMANFLISSQRRRLQYLLSEDNHERFRMITDAVQLSVRNKNRESPDKKKQPLVITDADSANALLKQRSIPEETRAHIKREIDKLDKFPKTSTEYSMVLDYLSWVFAIPWETYTREQVDLSTIEAQLDESHHGLEEVKAHVLEHMTIEHLKQCSTGMVLCFVGPPGTGKTSIAKQIAKATGRKLIRISLSGVSDEAEIRGHRRTYLGSRPGRPVVGLKQSGSCDPLFVLDEIDKLTTHKGDPAAALLELLDPEQNDQFIDRYLEIPVDFSKAMFVCTANYEDQIPEPLKDRMEFIYFKEYNRAQRYVITSNYLIPRAFQELAVDKLDISFTEDAIEHLSETKQIRKIDKNLRKALRRAAVAIVVNNEETVEITATSLQETTNNKKRTQIGFANRA